jgi:hypothetical protein
MGEPFMGRVLGIFLMVVAIWAGVEVYNEGVGGAFGGVFSRLPGASSLEAPANRSTPDRAADAFQRAYNKSEERVDRLLRESDPPE